MLVPESDSTGSVHRRDPRNADDSSWHRRCSLSVSFKDHEPKEQTMKLARAGMIAAAILAVATVAWALKPDFSGTWTLDPASAPPAGGGGRGGEAVLWGAAR